MVPEINWSKGAESTFDDALKYLEHNFSDKEVRKFAGKVQQRLNTIQSNPRFGRKISMQLNFRKTIINKRVALYCQYKPRKKEMELLVFWNTLQNPKRLKI